MAAAALSAEHHPDCYPSNPMAALDFFREALAAAPPADAFPMELGTTLAGVISPHIDFRVSRRAYAAAFRPLLDVPLAETYLILGVGHRSRLEWNLDRRDYVTPLGRAECVTEWVDALAEGFAPARISEPKAHQGEHSIEFALLWLQALHRLHPAASVKPVRFVPLLCGGMHACVEGLVDWDGMEDFHRLTRGLTALFREHPPGEKLRVIVSIDGCHLGPRFQHPFEVTPALLQATAKSEERLWAQVARGDARAFLDWMRDEGNDRYFDGVGALALLLAAAPAEGAPWKIQRTFYEQWFTERDASAVTFSSGCVLEKS
jgi:AmmeMemoRadiSam system protein B